jgi:phospholipid/cholesterol/gamma-HCH transport system permease protein
MISSMTSLASAWSVLADLGRSALQWFAGWRRILMFSARLLVLALSTSSYRGPNLVALSRHLVKDTAPILLWFTLMTSIISLVIIHIVVVTSVSYGLSRYALEMVVRVLVLELIPLTAAMFVALRCALPNAAEVAALHMRGAFDVLSAGSAEPLQREILPRVISGTFSVLLLATVSCVVAAVLAYLWVHGPTAGGFASYTRTFGRVFSPALSLIFTLKTLGLSLAVGLIPIASVLYDRPNPRLRTSTELRGLVRLFFMILLIEIASLVGNYL